jgi:hypothetical protein
VVTRGRWTESRRLLVCSRRVPVCSGTAPAVRPDRFRRVMGRLLPEGEGQESKTLLSAPRGISATCPVHKAAEPRGARDAHCRCRLPRGSANAEDRSAADTARTVQEKQDVLAACAGSDVALGSRDCEAVRLLSTQIVFSTGESNFIGYDTALCVQRRRQRFPTVRTVAERGNGEYEAKSDSIRACTSTVVCKPSWTLMI